MRICERWEEGQQWWWSEPEREKTVEVTSAPEKKTTSENTYNARPCHRTSLLNVRDSRDVSRPCVRNFQFTISFPIAFISALFLLRVRDDRFNYTHIAVEPQWVTESTHCRERAHHNFKPIAVDEVPREVNKESFKVSFDCWRTLF